MRKDEPIERLVRTAIHVLLWLAWTTFGFVAWCAILMRASLAYAGGLFARILAGKDTRGLDARLDTALHVWCDGFEHLRHARERSVGSGPDSSPVELNVVIWESIYTLGFVLVWAFASSWCWSFIQWLVGKVPWLAALLGLGLLVVVGFALRYSITAFRRPPRA